MTISLDDLISILEKHCQADDSSPRETLYIKFTDSELQTKNTTTYHIVDGGIVALDIDGAGEVFGLEII
jgi:uncharacterized protein YuzE